MKKVTVLGLAILLFVNFYSCEEEDGCQLLGKWLIVSTGSITYRDGVKISEEINDDPWSLCFEFLRGGVGHIYWTEDNYTIFSWVRNVTSLTLTMEGSEPEFWTIDKLTNSTLEISASTIYENNGVIYVHQYIITFNNVD